MVPPRPARLPQRNHNEKNATAPPHGRRAGHRGLAHPRPPRAADCRHHVRHRAAVHRRHHRRRGDQPYAGLALGHAGADRLGRHRLSGDRRDVHAARRLAVRLSRPAAHDAGRRPRLRRAAAAHRLGGQPRADDPAPRRARPLRRGAGAAVAGGDARHLSAREARHGDRALGHRHDPRARLYADARRLARRDLQLALGLLCHHALRAACLPHPAAAAAGRACARDSADSTSPVSC